MKQTKTYDTTAPQSIGRGSGNGTLQDFKKQLQKVWQKKCAKLKLNPRTTDKPSRHLAVTLTGDEHLINGANLHGKPGLNIVSMIMLMLGLSLGVFAATPEAVTETQIRWALGQIESGAISPKQEPADFKLGRKREVSRYQILPDQWRTASFKLQAPSSKLNPANPDDAWVVARTLLAERGQDFFKVTNRKPTPIDLYILWNAPGQFARVKYDPKNVSWVVRDRAERFANLVGIAPGVLVSEFKIPNRRAG